MAQQSKLNIQLEGFQAILEPGKYGKHLLQGIVLDEAAGKKLYEQCLATLEGIKNKEGVEFNKVGKLPVDYNEFGGDTTIKTSWNPKHRVKLVDESKQEINNPRLPLYSGAKVAVVVEPRAYYLDKDKTVGVYLRPLVIQVLELNKGEQKSGLPKDDFDQALNLL